jgi:hypothetical protein
MNESGLPWTDPGQANSCSSGACGSGGSGSTGCSNCYADERTHIPGSDGLVPPACLAPEGGEIELGCIILPAIFEDDDE